MSNNLSFKTYQADFKRPIVNAGDPRQWAARILPKVCRGPRCSSATIGRNRLFSVPTARQMLRNVCGAFARASNVTQCYIFAGSQAFT